MKHKGTKSTKGTRSSGIALCALSVNHSLRSLFSFRKLCVVLLAGVLCIPAGFADPFGTNLTLQAALDYGAENNPQLKSAFQQWQGVEYNISVQKALPDPMLTYGYFFESVETKVGPQNQSFGLSQKFPGFGKRSSMKSIATDMAAAEQQRYRREKLNLDFSITRAYAELYYLKRSVGITRDRIDLIRNLEEVARQRYASGSSMAPVLQAQVELGRLEDQLNSLKDMQQSREATLNALLNLPAEGALPITSSLPYRSVAADAAADVAEAIDRGFRARFGRSAQILPLRSADGACLLNS